MDTSQEATNYIGPETPTLDLWRYFLIAENGRTAKCRICSKVLKTTGGSTIGLYSHIFGLHKNITNHTIENPIKPSMTKNVTNCPVECIKINRSKKTSAEAAVEMNKQSPVETYMPNITIQSVLSVSEMAKPSKKRKITDYYRPADTMETMVARMVALDGISFRLLTESKDLRRLFQCSGYNLPESIGSISQMLVKNTEDIKEDTKKAIADVKKIGHKFTLTLDEWTSKRNKRYLNISLHCKARNTCYILGPVNITESTSSVAAFSNINDYLKTYNISIQEDIVSLTTDGSSDMRKIGIHFPGHHQWCLAQGVQSAVISTMYRTMHDCIQETNKNMQDIEQSTDTLSGTDNSFNKSGEFEVEKPHAHAELHLHKRVIDKLREVVKLITGSRLNAAALQAYVKKDLDDSDTLLQIDNQRSWTSMVDMIGSFLKLKNCVITLLNDIGSSIVFTKEELECLREVHLNLDLLRLVILSLCRENATLFTADTALRCALIQLEQLHSDLSLRLAANLRKRIKDRRLLIAGVLHYLYDCKSFKAFPDNDKAFLKPTSDQITELIVSLLKQIKFKCVTEDSNNNIQRPSSSKQLHATTVLLCDQEMELTIKNKGHQTIESANFDLQALVFAERKTYEMKGERGICLTKAYEYLLNVMPTNIQPDRTFAVCGCVSTRIISSHPDNILEAFIFLRTYYKEQRHVSKKQEEFL